MIGGSNVQAIQYTLQNIDGSAATGAITDNAGNRLVNGSGVASLGVFTSDADVTTATSVSNLLTFYTEVGNNTFGSGFTGAAFDGVVQRDISGTSVSGQIYSIIGNAATLAASTEVFVYKHTGFSFAADPGPPANDTLIISSQSDILIGGYDKTTHDFGGGDVASFNLEPVLVPEPSSTALLGLGGVALLLRRRR